MPVESLFESQEALVFLLLALLTAVDFYLLFVTLNLLVDSSYVAVQTAVFGLQSLQLLFLMRLIAVLLALQVGDFLFVLLLVVDHFEFQLLNLLFQLQHFDVQFVLWLRLSLLCLGTL